MIGSRKSMEYLWYKRTDELAHTGIVFKFDETLKYILDYGADEPSLMTKMKVGFLAGTGTILRSSALIAKATNMNFAAKVILRDFSFVGVDIIGRLVKLPLTNLVEKNNAKKVFNAIINITMGKYNFVTNNCRHFVITVARVLHQLAEFDSSDWDAFEMEIQRLMSKDEKRLKILLDYSLSDFIRIARI